MTSLLDVLKEVDLRMYTLIATAKLNDIDPQAWLADIIARISDLPASRLPELLPWNWNAAKQGAVKAA